MLRRVSGDETERSRTVSVSYRYRVVPPLLWYRIVWYRQEPSGIAWYRERTNWREHMGNHPPRYPSGTATSRFVQLLPLKSFNILPIIVNVTSTEGTSAARSRDAARCSNHVLKHTKIRARRRWLRG